MCKELENKRAKIICSLIVANERAVIRHAFHAFLQWRLEAEVEKRALDRRQQLFLINNAKLQVQRSKTALQSLYRQKLALKGGGGAGSV